MEIFKPNRNKTDLNKFNQFIKTQNSAVDRELKQMRIKENILFWEENMTKYKGIKYSQKIAQNIRDKYPVRILVSSKDAYHNEYVTYAIAKHLINSGVAPSKTVITSLDECYLSVRGFGEQAEVKSKIFDEENELIIIENVREIRNTDVKDNVYSFWQELFILLSKNRKLNILLSFNAPDIKDFYPHTKKDNTLKNLGFVKI